MTRIHLDTDLGGDPDDLCALAMLLGWRGVEITGITTTADRGGLRAAYVRYVLELAGHNDIPVAAGAEVTLSSLNYADPVMNDERFWPASLVGQPSPPGAALDLLSRSIDLGATIVGIGSYTNLALLEVIRSGSLRRVPVVVMGGWIEPRRTASRHGDRTMTGMFNGTPQLRGSSRQRPISPWPPCLQP